MPEKLIEPDDVGAQHVPRPQATVFGVEVERELVLYDEASNAIHLLDPLATVVWGCFDGEVSLGELVTDLADAFGTDEATVEQDVVALVRDLGRKGLLEGVSPEERYISAATLPGAERNEDHCEEDTGDE